ncbi:MAG: hypothetical protein IT379_02365 [Deltaproteobacteria bacterium]|nr:hypothetical protein [Deltaproteobacteria bacterium]
MKLGNAGAIALAIVLGAVAPACGDDDGGSSSDAGRDSATPDAGPRSATSAIFDPIEGPMTFQAVGFPNDLLLDETGHLTGLGELPGEANVPDPSYQDGLRQTLAELDGFSAVAPVFLYFRGALDPASLPGTPTASTEPSASVALVNVDEGSPDVGTRVPIRVHWNEELGQIAARPAIGYPLVPGRSYALVVTDALRGEDGLPVAPDPDLATVRDAQSAPADPALARAWALYDPVFDRLEDDGVARGRIVALSPFTVQTVAGDLTDARAIVHALAPPAVADVERFPREGYTLDDLLGHPAMPLPGRGNPSSDPAELQGLAHEHIGFVINGYFDSPSFLSDRPGHHGRFVRDEAGMLRVRSTERVPFTLVLPRGMDASGYRDLRVVLFQHGLSDDRTGVFGIADTLCGAGLAVLAIDAPFHGMRAVGTEDVVNRLTGAMRPDGFGDLRGMPIVTSFAGVLASDGELGAFQPVYLRDAMRQAVVDQMTAARLMREGDWSRVRALAPELSELSFSTEPMAVVGISLGSMIATQLFGAEPELTAAVLSVPGGSFIEMVQNSRPFNEGYLPLLFPLLGIDVRASDVEYDGYAPVFYPELAVWQTLLDRGDPIAHARGVRLGPGHVLMTMARNDETIHNSATEALARAMALPIASGDEPIYTDMASAAPPLRANYASSPGTMTTRGLWVYEPATHACLLDQRGESSLVPPGLPPFESRDEPVPVENPIGEIHAQVVRFLESWVAGAPEVAAPTMR